MPARNDVDNAPRLGHALPVPRVGRWHACISHWSIVVELISRIPVAAYTMRGSDIVDVEFYKMTEKEREKEYERLRESLSGRSDLGSVLDVYFLLLLQADPLEPWTALPRVPQTLKFRGERRRNENDAGKRDTAGCIVVNTHTSLQLHPGECNKDHHVGSRLVLYD
jgi:hypothetical protein